MFCPAGTSLESRELSYLWGRPTGTHVLILSRISRIYMSIVLYIPDFVIAVSSLYRAPALVIWGCVPVPGHVFTLITPPPLIISVVQSTASVQVYNALYTGCTAQVSAASEWAPTYTHSHQVPSRIYRERLCIAKGLQSYFAGSSRPSSFLPIHCLLTYFLASDHKDEIRGFTTLLFSLYLLNDDF